MKKTNRNDDQEPSPLEKFGEAVYTPSVVPLFRGNPYIEALPPNVTDVQMLYRQLQSLPPWSEEDVKQPVAARLHMLLTMDCFFQPLTRHFSLAQDLDGMIRGGYLSRNPMKGTSVVPGLAYSAPKTLRSAALIGCAGVGKTYSVTHILSQMYGDPVNHRLYQGNEMQTTQLAWLKVECPSETRGLCLLFFRAVDEVLGTSYQDKYGGSRSTTSDYIPGMKRICNDHALGLLVIDEIQNLGLKAHQMEELFSFLVQIINEFKVPILMVGTFAAQRVLTAAFRAARRATGLAHPIWERMMEDSEEWSMFMETLWRYQYVQNPVPLTDELRHQFYYETQGVTDLAVRLFGLVQKQAINDEIEQITIENVRMVADKALVLNKEFLAALRAGKPTGDAGEVKRVIDPYELPLADEVAPAKPVPLTKAKKKAAKAKVQAMADVEPAADAYEEMKAAGLVADPTQPKP